MNTPEWISFHLFTNHCLDVCLEKAIAPILHDLRINMEITKWFFIRYWERGPHIRLRLLIFPDAFESTLNTIVNHWSPLGRCERALYQPEVERYGGPDVICEAESIFQISSEFSLNYLTVNQPSNADRLAAAILSSALLVRASSLKYKRDEDTWPIRSYVCKTPSRSALEERSAEEVRIGRRLSTLDFDIDAGSAETAIADPKMIIWYNRLRPIWARVVVLMRREDSSPRLCHIVQSQLHMHVNRFGLHGSPEEFIFNAIGQSWNRNA